jgi:ectoine hydroxylase-related dioxygenase (phytanoyl-CoA dioxygenase family)
MTILDAAKQMISDLWLDQPDAHDRIGERVEAGELSSADAEKLREFTDAGYLTFSIGLDTDFAAAFDAELDQLWQQRPADLAVAPKSGGRVSMRDIDETHRYTGYRIADLHSHSSTARELYLHPEIFRMVELILDQKAVAFQSLYFRFGSEQGLHRDPMFVVTNPPSHLVASWIALEDITPECGPLIYVAGSHRMPWFEFERDTVTLGDKAGAQEKRIAWTEHRQRMIKEMNLEARPFTAKRGDVFIWHGGLLHGGARVEDEHSTRKSFVVHYSTANTYRSRRATMQWKSTHKGKEVWQGVAGTTDELLIKDGHAGIDNPLRHMGDRFAARSG